MNTAELDELAIIITEAMNFDQDPAAAIATIRQASNNLARMRTNRPAACVRITHSNGILVDRYVATRRWLDEHQVSDEVSTSA